jgi:acyl-CoA synthetase (AMP-forming)/AMP-acid ligase II
VNPVRPAQACGVPLPVDSALPPTLLEGIRRRLDQAPEARLWTVDGQGGVVCTRYADLWTRAVRIRAGLVGAGILPGRVLVVALIQATDCVAAFWPA